MKKFLTVLLVIAVMFTFSFGTAMATSTEDAMAQALASAKASAVQSLNNFVKLTDYDADGQAEVKELIDEGTMLINLQTEVSGVSTTLASYQTKLLAVKNANTNAVKAAQKAAKESIADYISVLVDTKCYDKAKLNAAVATYLTDIDKQQVVIGVELMRDQAYAAIEKVKMETGKLTDAEAAKALAEAKVAAINTVKGLWTGNDEAKNWNTIAEEKATAEQVAAYKAKVNEVVAAIKAATTPTALAKYVREKAEVEALAAKTEKAAAQSAVKKALYNWAYGLDYALYDNYTLIKKAVETIKFADDATNKGYAYFTNDTIQQDAKYKDGTLVTVVETKDVDKAVARLKAIFEDLGADDATTTAKNTAISALKAKQAAYDVSYETLAAAEQAVYAATTKADVEKLQKDYLAAWKAAAMAADDDYNDYVKDAVDAVNAALAKAEKNEAQISADELNALVELADAAIAEIKSDALYKGLNDDSYKAKITSNVKAFEGAAIGGGRYDFTTGDNMAYADILAAFVSELDEKVPAGAGDKACNAIVAATRANIAAAKTITAAYNAFVEGKAKINAYEASTSSDELITLYKEFKAAVGVVDALPDTDEVTLNDREAVLAAYKAFYDDGAIRTQAYAEKTLAGNNFVGEADAIAKIKALYTLVGGKNGTDGDLAGALAQFKSDAYNKYFTASKFDEFNADQQAALNAAYNAGVAAIAAAAKTGYADDISYVVEDAEKALENVLNKEAVAALAALVADAKAFLKTTYDPAEYSAEGLAKIDEILATLDACTDEEEVAKATVAARKAIAAVEETLVETNAAKINAVQSLKLKASSKAGKGYITVSWKVTGDADKAEGYQLYKSTKAQKGYKKCITTSKTSFKNTKNLKKGVRYFYKVRAYVTVDGTKYYSDWSNKANRVAK